jgi:Zn-dependent M28 family amino/carboxypeptidase
LQKWQADKAVTKGAVVFVPAEAANRSLTRKLISAGAVAVLMGFGPQTAELFAHFKREPATLEKEGKTNSLLLSQEATNAVSKMNDGEMVTFASKISDVERKSRNVIAILPGETDEVVMISAHYDHLGVRPGQADPIYNGADDDASGTVAVLELAEGLSRGKKPRRTVYFVLFGSEEFGSLGGDYFQKHPPLDLNKIVAQIEFEMIGRPDPKVKPGTLWMTGFERTDLGPELAKHGAALVADPHPEQNFFERSDNFPMAKRGVVAQTISSYGLHPQYHQPDDDIAHIDFAHMTHAIESMVEPIEWLVNSDFKPQWKPGMKP